MCHHISDAVSHLFCDQRMVRKFSFDPCAPALLKNADTTRGRTLDRGLALRDVYSGRSGRTAFRIRIHRPLHSVNPLNAELNPICYLLTLLGAHHFLHVSRIRVKSLTLRLLMSYIYMERLFLMFLDHTQRHTTVGRTPLDE